MHAFPFDLQDLTIGSAKLPAEVPEELREPPAAPEEPGLLQRLPFVELTDSIAERLGLPQSREVEALGRGVSRWAWVEARSRLLGAPMELL